MVRGSRLPADRVVGESEGRVQDRCQVLLEYVVLPSPSRGHGEHSWWRGRWPRQSDAGSAPALVVDVMHALLTPSSTSPPPQPELNTEIVSGSTAQTSMFHACKFESAGATSRDCCGMPNMYTAYILNSLT